MKNSRDFIERGYQSVDGQIGCTQNCAGRVMKANVTLRLDRNLLREVRLLAAEEGRSTSALLSESLEAMIRDRKAFSSARRRALARLREGIDLQWTPPDSRDGLHER